jgi:chemotaxis receptor (MCP) glutamine deamidase CheD
MHKVHTTLIGGASVLIKNSTGLTIGEQNIREAEKILHENRISINRQLTGGEEGYTLWYHHKSNRLQYRKHGSDRKFEL